MDATRYNIYFAGQLLEGNELASVSARMAKLFNADEATLAKLFSGRTQLIKRDCDKATALKFKRAIESAGAVPVIRPVAADSATTARTGAGEPMTAAQKIAAMAAAAAPDPGHREQAPGSDRTTAPRPTEPSPGGIQLAPAGTAALRPDERQAPVPSAVRTPDLNLDASGQRLSEPPPPSPPPPDTSHLSARPVGELLPGLPSSHAPQAPDTSAIELAPDGTDLSDCAARAAAEPDLDLSGIELAPAGADVLEQKYRTRHDAPEPPTDHLNLED